VPGNQACAWRDCAVADTPTATQRPPSNSKFQTQAGHGGRSGLLARRRSLRAGGDILRRDHLQGQQLQIPRGFEFAAGIGVPAQGAHDARATRNDHASGQLAIGHVGIQAQDAGRRSGCQPAGKEHIHQLLREDGVLRVELEPYARSEVGHPFKQTLDIGVFDPVLVDGQPGRTIRKLAGELRRLRAQVQQLLVVEVDDARVQWISSWDEAGVSP